MTEVIWPKGKKTAAFRRKVERHTHELLTGSLLAVDPASGSTSMPGYALFTQGRLVECGVITIEYSDKAQERLASLAECMRRNFPSVDVLVVEELRGPKVHNVLHWATGTIISMVKAGVLIEAPTAWWKAYAKTQPGYEKADDQDALMIGETVLAIAREHQTRDS
jgi:hypothetical protein